MKILMRMGRNPFDAYTPEEALNKNLLATNSGNLIFLHAAHKLLSTNENTVTPYRYTPRMDDVEWVNNNFDIFVMPFANAFRVSYEKHLKIYTQFIKKLNIPVMIFSIGTQTDLECSNFSKLKKIEGSVKEFCDAVLEKSKSIGVRGDCTKKYLLSLGYSEKEITIIGCPSMFMMGKNLSIVKKYSSIDKYSKISFNLSPYSKNSLDLVHNILDTFSDVTYIPQNNRDLKTCLYDTVEYKYDVDEVLYKNFFKEGKVKFFIHPKSWIDFLESRHFSIGTRIHGTITSLISGTPALLIAHDSRTKELAEYFEIPYLKNKDIENADFIKLYEEINYDNCIRNHSKRFQVMNDFLMAHGLSNIFDNNNDFLKKYETKFNKIKDSMCVNYLFYEERNTLIKRIKYLGK